MTPMTTVIRNGRTMLVWSLGILMAFALHAASAAGVAAPIEDPNLRKANGMFVYLGVIPAQIVRGHAQSHPEATMHGGAPRGSSERHVMIALFDAKTFERITDAEITATVEGLGHVGRTTKKLERMDIADAPTFGGYFSFQGKDKFTIRIEIKTAQRPIPTIVEFTYET